jgi:hypothetical protein
LRAVRFAAAGYSIRQAEYGWNNRRSLSLIHRTIRDELFKNLDDPAIINIRFYRLLGGMPYLFPNFWHWAGFHLNICIGCMGHARRRPPWIVW